MYKPCVGIARERGAEECQTSLGILWFEAILIDLQRSDLRLQCGSRYAQLGGGARRSVHAPSAFPQSTLNDGFLLRGTRFKNVKPAVLLDGNRSSRKPALVNREILSFTDDHRSLNHVLQLANVTRPGVRLKQIEALFVHRLKALSCFPCVAINEVLDQQGNVFSSFPK